ncbi:MULTISPECIES: sugar ABC transporter ATP-binding protein [unclassified Mesorhizobium]|uniref:sugar ABC transporter ATP-binding protein n=1 Tax=unclassified Mesorhizobium TaxID=325217 RepID=UPI00112609B0|nr:MULTISPECIES: sugar ABC transporter ATP-binding protein [unclassified Mesorhizobium]TPN47731.1 sugar ABC transporter ATP-binding protein [Mesorhizobium sp. B1-1-7]TPN58406.1 sugar ABC transporter ATP-binding protein [Mesorhizobium sp. B1-1-9]
MSDASQEPLFSATAIAKNFSGVQALRGVDFDVVPGEIHALLGQNGAGKSTLVKILNGVHPAGSYSGIIKLDGQAVNFTSPADARSNGVGYVPQEIEVLEQLSVAENVFAGRTGLGVLVHQRKLEKRAGEIFADLGIAISPKAYVASLTSAQRHLVMIARAIVLKPRVLMLDEPTASLSGTEVDALFSVLRRLKAQGVAMIYITHRLPEVLAICDRATVLRDGQVAVRIAREDFDAETFIFSMSGQRLQRLFPEHAAPMGAPTALEVRSLTVAGHSGAVHGARDIALSVAAGEIVGLAGLLGSGRSEILHGIYGRVPAEGEIRVAGQAVSIRSPSDARAVGIALLTEDRKRDGLLFNLPVGANITIGNLAPLSRHGMVRGGLERGSILAAMRALNVKASSPQAAVTHLSGGNQQKLLFARVLMRAPKVLLLDEPTKGVDAATRHEIYKLVVELAEKGVALIIVASELEELIGLCDRCLVVADGSIVDEFSRGEGGEDRVLRAVTAAQAERHAMAARGSP